MFFTEKEEPIRKPRMQFIDNHKDFIMNTDIDPYEPKVNLAMEKHKFIKQYEKILNKHKRNIEQCLHPKDYDNPKEILCLDDLFEELYTEIESFESICKKYAAETFSWMFK